MIDITDNSKENIEIAAAPTEDAFHLPDEIALATSSKLVAFVYLKAAICSPLLALSQISFALFSYSKAAFVSAASVHHDGLWHIRSLFVPGCR